MQREAGEAYINFEFNAAGVCYAAHHQSPSEAELLSSEEFASIERWATHLGQHGLELTGAHALGVTVAIPWTTMGYEAGKLPTSLRANLYKCGDRPAISLPQLGTYRRGSARLPSSTVLR